MCLCRFSHVIAHRCNQHGDDRKCPFVPRVRGTFTLKNRRTIPITRPPSYERRCPPRTRRERRRGCDSNEKIRRRSPGQRVALEETGLGSVPRVHRRAASAAWIPEPVATERDKYEPAGPKHSARAAIQASYYINRPLQARKSPSRFSNISRGLVWRANSEKYRSPFSARLCARRFLFFSVSDRAISK